MRNLVVLNKGSIFPESRTYPDLKVINAVFDSVTDSITYALCNEHEPVLEIQQFMKNGTVNLLASFDINNDSKLLSFNHFIDTCQLVLTFANGDIVTATYDPSAPNPDTTVVEIVGSIDVGLLASRWSHDEETLCLVTSERNIILLSRHFEPISERQLNTDDIKITDSKHVSVGWGKKETQFTGKGMRAKERAKKEAKSRHNHHHTGEITSDPTVQEVERGTLSTHDSGKVEISWRGDCEYFSISTVEPVLVEDTQETYDRRVIRVFTRIGELDSVNEAVDGLEGNLAWKPQGSLIASTQRHTEYDDEIDQEFETLDLVFYERNGLRHGQFNTRLNPETDIIEALHWSADSEVLAFQLKDRIQLWTTKNYHWYLKQEILAPEGEITFMHFHPEKPLHLMYGTSDGSISVVDLAIKFATGPTKIGFDQGMVLVADGTTVKITPLAIANVPPPIAFREFDVPHNITDLAVNRENSKIVVLTSNNDLHILEIDLKSSSKQPKLSNTIEKSAVCSDFLSAQQVAVTETMIAVSIGSVIKLFDLVSGEFLTEYDIQSKIVILKTDSDFSKISFETIDSRVFVIDETTLDPIQVSKFPHLCREYELAEIDGSYVAFGISVNGKLFANEKQIFASVTSMKITESHLVFTNAQAKLCFVHLKGSNFEFEIKEDETVREIERGSVLVSALPSKYSIVLEAQRGNLETIFPRIMVLSGVRQYISNLNYREAFLACRTHRIDLDILHDYRPELFFANLEKFINQVNKVDHLDLFVSCLHEEDVCETKYKETGLEDQMSQLNLNNDKQQTEVKTVEKSKINKICEAIVSILSQPEYFATYLQTIITAYACMKPANLTGAFELIRSIDNESQVDSTVTHLCFLQDVNKLYNVCLGMYDVKLTLIVAQKSQKDPKEYLPFLQKLHEQSELRRKFMIDDHLKNYDKALNWLYEMGESAHDEFDEYMTLHESYKAALKLYSEDPKRTNAILSLYAAHLQSSSNNEEAALIYDFLERWEDALENYIIAKKWNEALSIVETHFNDKLAETSDRLITSLTEDHKYKEAANIEVYLGHIFEAVRLYCKSYCFEDALFLTSRYPKQKDELMVEIDAQLGEGFGTIAELLADCKSQLNSQLRRLRELRSKKEEDPFSFYGVSANDDTPDNVSIAASETSTTPSFFTRYTGKTSGTAKTGASRRSSKNRKREERKKAKGRKGTIYEEEYLIKSVGRLIERLDQTEKDAIKLIEALIRRQRKEQAYQIQSNWISIIDFLKENIVEIHKMNERDRERINDNGEVYLIPEIPVPKINDFPKKNILDY